MVSEVQNRLKTQGLTANHVDDVVRQKEQSIKDAENKYTRKLTQMVNKLKIETSISLRMRDEEVEIHGKSNCWDIGRR